MARFTTSAGIGIEYESLGDESNPALLLIMGYTVQLIGWELEFCNMFVDAGYRVIRFDNRDCGLSTHFDGVIPDMDAVLTAMMTNNPSALVGKVPYTLSDMAADAADLIDHLGIERAHVVGASMGGMIAQTLAIEHPSKVRTLTSIMSMTGEIEYGQSTPEAQAALLAPAPTSREDYINSSATWTLWMSKRYTRLEEVRDRAAKSYDRCFYPEGASRQLAAIVASGSRADKLAALAVPTLVIHGFDDQLISPSGGKRTAELIPGARLLLVEDMGHDLPRELWSSLSGEIITHLRSTSVPV